MCSRYPNPRKTNMLKTLFTAMAAVLSCIVVVLTMCSPARAANPAQWRNLTKATEKDNFSIDLNIASFRPMENKSGDMHIAVDVRISKPDSTAFFIYVISTESCDNGHGTLAALSMDKTVITKSQIYLQGGTYTSLIADVLCGVYEEVRKQNSNKPTKNSKLLET